jgi:heme-degrading monooxygenase HmoA
VILWEYVVRPGKVEAFVAAYGPGGPWAELFARAEGFEATELYRQEDEPTRFLTIDRWRSRADFEAFRVRCEPDYYRLDDRFAELTLEEDRIGAFERV